MSASTPPGIINLGNTCFLNSILQALGSSEYFVAKCNQLQAAVNYCTHESQHSKELEDASYTSALRQLAVAVANTVRNLFSDDDDGLEDREPLELPEDEAAQAPLLLALAHCLAQLHPVDGAASKAASADPVAVLTALRQHLPDTRLEEGLQHDAAEALESICAALEHEINSFHKLCAQPYLSTLNTWRQTPGSITHSITDPQKLLHSWTTCGHLPTKGYMVNKLMCLSCGNKFAQQPQPFFVLPLTLPATRGRLSLLQCLQLFSSMEVIQGAACPRCCLRASLAGAQVPEQGTSSPAAQATAPAAASTAAHSCAQLPQHAAEAAAAAIAAAAATAAEEADSTSFSGFPTLPPPESTPEQIPHPARPSSPQSSRSAAPSPVLRLSPSLASISVHPPSIARASIPSDSQPGSPVGSSQGSQGSPAAGSHHSSYSPHQHASSSPLSSQQHHTPFSTHPPHSAEALIQQTPQQQLTHTTPARSRSCSPHTSPHHPRHSLHSHETLPQRGSSQSLTAAECATSHLLAHPITISPSGSVVSTAMGSVDWEGMQQEQGLAVGAGRAVGLGWQQQEQQEQEGEVAEAAGEQEQQQQQHQQHQQGEQEGPQQDDGEHVLHAHQEQQAVVSRAHSAGAEPQPATTAATDSPAAEAAAHVASDTDPHIIDDPIPTTPPQPWPQQQQQQPPAPSLLQRLQQLSSSTLPLPDLDYQQLLAQLPGAPRWLTTSSSVVKQSSILRLPQLLCLHLQRSGWSSDGMPSKYSGHISFPLTLDMQCFTAAGADDEGSNDLLTQYSNPAAAGSSGSARAVVSDSVQRSSEYGLVAVVVHLSFSSAVGHYVVYVRRQQIRGGERLVGIAPRAVDRWYRMSDHSASEVELGEVLACQATLLVYETGP